MDPIRNGQSASSPLQLASYAPPEELVSRAPAASTAAATSAAEAPIPLERVPMPVLLCHRPVTFLPAVLARGTAALGADHRWLQVGSKEVGMGPEDGRNPVDHFARPGGRTRLMDHSGQSAAPGSSCDVVREVDPECVEKTLRVGQFTGAWTPGLNDCHTVVDDILASCARPTPVPADDPSSGTGRP
jgi:hypothetical protein